MSLPPRPPPMGYGVPGGSIVPLYGAPYQQQQQPPQHPPQYGAPYTQQPNQYLPQQYPPQQYPPQQFPPTYQYTVPPLQQYSQYNQFAPPPAYAGGYSSDPMRGYAANRGAPVPGVPSGEAAATAVHSNGKTVRADDVVCESCDMGFRNAEGYKQHVACHVKCEFAGCPFMAVPTAMKIHCMNDHGVKAMDAKVEDLPADYQQEAGFQTVTIDVGQGSQRFNIPLGEDEEDIRKWREERRRRWPSKANVARKQLQEHSEESEKEDQRKKRMEHIKGKFDNEFVSEKELRCMRVTGLLEEDCYRGAEAFKNTTAADATVHHCNYFLSRGCMRASKCPQIHCPLALHEFHISKYKESQDRNRELKRVESLYGKSESKAGLSLLEKLLEDDVKQEAMLTVACFKYLIDCNFMQGEVKKGEKRKAEEEGVKDS